MQRVNEIESFILKNKYNWQFFTRLPSKDKENAKKFNQKTIAMGISEMLNIIRFIVNNPTTLIWRNYKNRMNS